MFRWLCVVGVLLLCIVSGADINLRPSIQSPQKPAFSTDQFKLLTQPRDFALQFVSKGQTKQISVPRDWLIPQEAEKEEEEGAYVSSFHYDTKVQSFPIGNGRIGLHLSSYAIQEEGSAQAAAGRDVFLIFDPASSAVFPGGIDRGVTKERVRSQRCFAASAESYFLADVNGDGLTDIGVVKEELECVQSNKREDVDLIVGPFYKQLPVVWYVFKGKAWKLEPSFSGKFPEHYQELPFIGIDRSPVDVVGCNLWRTCDRTKWPTGEKGPAAHRNSVDCELLRLLTPCRLFSTEDAWSATRRVSLFATNHRRLSGLRRVTSNSEVDCRRRLE